MSVDSKTTKAQTRTKGTIKNLEAKVFKYDIHPWVFFGGATIIILGVVFSLALGSTAETIFGNIQSWIANATGWFFVLVMNVILIFCVILMLSKYGALRIGGPDAEPEFSTLSWFAMLFSAGMGIGILFYGVAEPMFHFAANPFAEPGTAESAQRAMDLTFLHWGFHPWAVYALVGLGLAFFGFSEGLPLSIRNVFYPLLGNKIYGPLGNLIDILATVSCLYGVATSLGLGVQQVNAGLSHLFGLPQTSVIQCILIAGITAMATWSVVRGLDGGIKFLSNINLAIAGLLLFFVFILGPTLFILNAFVENIGHYFQVLPSLAFWNESYTAGDWQNGWTVFYWGWWIAWSPFVGMFIARVSYGRRIREYLMGVLLVPTVVTFFWMTVFGDSAIYTELFGVGGLSKSVQENIPVSLFVFLEQFPLSLLTSIMAVIVVISFFVTSSDSGSMVIDIITAGGNPDPPKPQRLFWAITEGAVAAILLLGGGLVALQTAAITTGLPFAVVVLMMCWATWVGLRQYVEKYGWD
ncbi:MAG TPA: BCCT family transporter [Desulfohalobiaceae bacterium]|nr:BCCT family transporter [Desulfohalobiaceae bacterium]